jgi:putative membrane protein
MMKMKNSRIMTFTRGLAVTAFVIAALAIRADDSTKSTDSTSSSSKKYSAGDKESVIKESAKMHMATEKFAELASEKAQNPQLKQYAQKLAQDHKQSQQELEKLAQKHNVTLPTTLDDKCKEEISRLQGLSGEEFDREFAKGAIEGHAMAMAHLQQASSSATDTDLRQYTQSLLAKVREHQREGREVARAVGVDQTTITSLERKAQDSVGGPAAGESSSSSTDSSSSSSSKSKSSDSSTDKSSQDSSDKSDKSSNESKP